MASSSHMSVITRTRRVTFKRVNTVAHCPVCGKFFNTGSSNGNSKKSKRKFVLKKA